MPVQIKDASLELAQSRKDTYTYSVLVVIRRSATPVFMFNRPQHDRFPGPIVNRSAEVSQAQGDPYVG